MKKVLLDLSVPCTKEKTHEYIAEQMGFPSYYGKNLDALYDELTSIHEPTAVGIFLPIADMIDLDIDLMIYFDKISEVFSDAEAANPELAVIFGDLMANPEYVDEFGDLLDSYLDGDDA
ncbi:MAG: barstar family protein, partial [Eubacteriales bacterium]|nr:barstar family protein [Eubacteriales bacterium]